MKELDIKATIYDIFGYVLPGLIIICIGIISHEHRNGIFNFNYFSELLNAIDGKEVTLLFFLSYILGHALSSISSLFIEKNLVFRYHFLSNPLRVNNLLSEGLKNQLMAKFKNEINFDINDKDFRFLITYVQSKQPEVYSTAFVYLAFYGMARTITFNFIVGLLFETINIFYYGYRESVIFATLYLGLSLIFGYHYYRFMCYFREQIAMGFILPVQ